MRSIPGRAFISACMNKVEIPEEITSQLYSYSEVMDEP